MGIRDRTKGTPVTRFGAELILPQSLAGATPLLLAGRFGEAGMMRTLLSAGADPRLTLNDGTTLLMAAAAPDRRVIAARGAAAEAGIEDRALAAARVALEAGCDVHAANHGGETAMSIAESRKFAAVVRLLAEKGAGSNVVNNSAGRQR